MSNDTLETSEQSDLLSTLAQHRQFLRFTARDLDDEQATRRTTVSELTIAGLIKHVAATEAHWAAFIVHGPAPADDWDSMTEQDKERYTNEFRLLPGETLASVLERYAEVAAGTDELIRSLPDLNASHPLPQAPWFPPGAQWSARRVLLHILAETAQHAGHADIIREALDGAKTMG
ncbi:MAG TPA: DinB family protein [Streptosporangiaceae bacterium]|jgi:uncharacterized damage-inducible protein DinB